MQNHTQTVCFFLEARNVVLGQPGNAADPPHSGTAQQRLSSIDVRLDSGTVTVLMGPNGAGKSTLLSVLAGQLLPDSGEIVLCEQGDPEQRPCGILTLQQLPRWNQYIGYMPERLPVFPHLSVRETLLNACYLKTGRADAENVQRVLEWCDLSSHAEHWVGSLSLGYRQRLNLARALVHRPKVLLMDEPMNGLDPHHVDAFKSTLLRLKEHLVILLSTHVLSEPANWSDRMLVMANGRLLGEIDPSESMTAMADTAVPRRWRLRFLHAVPSSVCKKVARYCPVLKNTETVLEITSTPSLNAKLLAELVDDGVAVCELSLADNQHPEDSRASVWRQYQTLLTGSDNHTGVNV